MTKAEQETILRWDQEERIALLWTAYEPDARRWRKAGYDVRVYTMDGHGHPTSWSARVPVEAIRWRGVQDGRVINGEVIVKGASWVSPAINWSQRAPNHVGTKASIRLLALMHLNRPVGRFAKCLPAERSVVR